VQSTRIALEKQNQSVIMTDGAQKQEAPLKQFGSEILLVKPKTKGESRNAQIFRRLQGLAAEHSRSHRHDFHRERYPHEPHGK